MGKNDNIGVALGRAVATIIFMLDSSGSMDGARMGQLNLAMIEALENLKASGMAEEIIINVRIIEFNDNAQWIMGNAQTGISLDDAIDTWRDITAKPAGTNTAAAFNMARQVMHKDILGEKAYNPLVFLITDGESNNRSETKNMADSLKASLVSKNDPTRSKVTCVTIGVEDANIDELKDVASIGTIVRDDGTKEENVPLVFDVNNASNLGGLLKNLVASSVASVSANGNNAEGEIVVKENTKNEDDENWDV